MRDKVAGDDSGAGDRIEPRRWRRRSRRRTSSRRSSVSPGSGATMRDVDEFLDQLTESDPALSPRTSGCVHEQAARRSLARPIWTMSHARRTRYRSRSPEGRPHRCGRAGEPSDPGRRGSPSGWALPRAGADLPQQPGGARSGPHRGGEGHWRRDTRTSGQPADVGSRVAAPRAEASGTKEQSGASAAPEARLEAPPKNDPSSTAAPRKPETARGDDQARM